MIGSFTLTWFLCYFWYSMRLNRAVTSASDPINQSRWSEKKRRSRKITVFLQLKIPPNNFNHKKKNIKLSFHFIALEINKNKKYKNWDWRQLALALVRPTSMKVHCKIISFVAVHKLWLSRRYENKKNNTKTLNLFFLSRLAHCRWSNR